MSKVTTKSEVRLSYTNLITPRAQNAEKPDELTYSTAILIPKEDKETIDAVKAAVKEALADGVAKKWGGKPPKNLRNPLRDGDEKTDKDGNPDELYAGHFFLNAKGPKGGEQPPILLNPAGGETRSDSDIYSGVYARVSLQFFPYDKAGNRGIGCSVSAVQSAGRGDALGGTVTLAGAREEFGISTPASSAAADFNSDPNESESASSDDDDVWGS